MKKNVGMIDKAIRISTSLVVGGLYFDGSLTGTWAVILLVLSGVLILTGISGFCPLYSILNFSSKRKGL